MNESSTTTRNPDSDSLILPIAIYSLLGLARRSIWVLMLPVYLAKLPPRQFGILVLLTFTANILAVVSNLKLDAAVRTFYFDFQADNAARQRYLRQILTASLITATAIFSTSLLVGEAVFDWIFTHQDLRFYPLAPIAIATAFINACVAPYIVYLRNELRLRELAGLQLAWVACSIILQLLLIVIIGLGLFGALLGALIPAVLALVYVLLRTGFAHLHGLIAAIRPSLRYSGPLVAFSFFYLLESRLDTLMLEHFLDLDTLGGYAMLVSILGLLVFALNALDNALRPAMYPILRRADTSMHTDQARFQTIYVAIGLAVLSFAVMLGSVVGIITDEPEYLAFQRWLVLASMAFLPIIFTRYYALYYDYYKQSAALTAWTIFRTGLMFVLLLALVPGFGVAGAIYAVMASQLINSAAFLLSARHKFSIDAPLGSPALQVGAFVLIIWSLYYWLEPLSMVLFGSFQFIVVTLVLVALYRASVQREECEDF